MTPEDKVRALTAKTVSNGCTVPEMQSAFRMALAIVKNQKLPVELLHAPTGYEWEGQELVPKKTASPPTII